MKRRILISGFIFLALVTSLFVFRKYTSTDPIISNSFTYESPLGFSIEYPKEATIVEGDPGGLYLEESIDAPLPAVSIKFPRVDTFSENQSHGYYEFQVRVHGGMGKPEWGCNAAAFTTTGETQAGTVMIDGKTAHVFTGMSAGAGNRLEFTRYALCYNDINYSIYDIFASGSDGTPLTEKLEEDIARAKALNKKIIASFRIISQ